MPARPIFESQQCGSQAGTSFDGTPPSQYLEDAVLTRITVRHSSYITGFTLAYKNNRPPAINFGATSGTVKTLDLEPGELVTAVEVQIYSGSYVGQVAFVTTNRTWGPWGDYAGTKTTIRAQNQQPDSVMGLISLSVWHCSSYIRAIKAKFIGNRAGLKRPTVVKYESQDGASRSPDPSLQLSAFCRKLSSPTVTLCVGPEKMEFHASEDILCQLPFFRAALQGRFVEASTKVISLPEDPPHILGALIEYLYTGSYSYSYSRPRGSGAPDSKDNDIPLGSLPEVTFHLAVVALASKYDCHSLKNGSMRGLVCALNDLEGIDIIRWLKTAYDNGVVLEDLKKDKDLDGFMISLGATLRLLYDAHEDELDEAVLECPTLARDLLKHVLKSK